MRPLLSIAFVGMLSIGWGIPSTFADEEEEAEKRDIQSLVDKVADIEIDNGEGGNPLQFHKTPILKWPNVQRRTMLGGTFIWTRDERPEVIACLWDWEENGIWFAFQSFSTSKVVAKKGDATIWRSDKPDIEFKKFDGASPPADTPVKRLSQMKEFADRFRARVSRTGGKETEELRLLAKPIYRYKSGDIIDGALFAFVQGTDPEVILHLEARRLKGDKSSEKAEPSEWQYAISRRSVMPLEAMLDDKIIWSVQYTSGAYNEPFYQAPFPRGR